MTEDRTNRTNGTTGTTGMKKHRVETLVVLIKMAQEAEGERLDALLKATKALARDYAHKERYKAARKGAGDRLEVLAARLEGGLETREGDHRTEAAVIAPPMEPVTDPWEGGVGGDGTSGTDETHRTEGTGETGGTGDGEVVA